MTAGYLYVDTAVERSSPLLPLSPLKQLDDISIDCRVGIDDTLTLYDLQTNTIMAKLPYDKSTRTDSQLQVKSLVRYLAYRAECGTSVYTTISQYLSI